MFKSYIEQYIEQYGPYKNNVIYQLLISSMKTNFFEYSYNNVPKKLAELFSEQQISAEVIDIILLSHGYTDNIITNMSLGDKKVLLEVFPAYFKDKGTLKNIKNVSNSFNDPIKIYELYVDRRRLDGETYDWYFIPKPITPSPDDTLDKLPYDDIYNDTPTYFISKPFLHNAYINKDIVLPFKTNLLMMELNTEVYGDEISTLLSATLLNYYGNEYINFTSFDGTSFDVTLSSLYELWNYIHLLVFKASQGYDGFAVIYDPFSLNFPYTFDEDTDNNINDIINIYNSLNSTTELSEFYEEYIRGSFESPILSMDLSHDVILQQLYYSIGTDFMSYVESRVYEGQKIVELAAFLIEIRTCVINFINAKIKYDNDQNLAEHKRFLIQMFHPTLLSIKDTATWKLTDFFKPYHTQLIAKAPNTVISDSKFNYCMYDDESMIVLRDYPSSTVIVNDDYYFYFRINGYVQATYGSNTMLVSDNIALNLELEKDYVFTRHEYFPSEFSQKVIAIEHVLDSNSNPTGYSNIILENNYKGPEGIFDYLYKRFKDK